MKANTNGIAAIHAVRRNFQVEPSRKPNSIIGIGSFLELTSVFGPIVPNLVNMSISQKRASSVACNLMRATSM